MVRTWPDADTGKDPELRRDRQLSRRFGKPTVTPCEGCPKCSSTGGYVLRRGSGRCTTAHEFVFIFAKQADYFWDMEGVRENCLPSSTKRQAAGYNGNSPERDAGAGYHNETRIPRSVLTFSTEPFKGKHFATFPSSLPAFCIRAGSPPRCCAACKSPYAPVVESERVATRPGENGKMYDVLTRRGDCSSDNDIALKAGNRDPQRHVAVTRVLGYRKTCQCATDETCPATILDPFGGSGTTAWAAKWLGRDYILCELNPEYAALAEMRINGRPPKWARKGKAPPARSSNERVLFE